MQTRLQPNPSLKGVKFGHITNTIDLLGGRDALYGLSTRTVCDALFELYGQQSSLKSLVEDELMLNLPSVLGSPEIIVSYATETTFLDVVDAVELFLQRNPEYHEQDKNAVIIWLDVFSLPRNYYQLSEYAAMSLFYRDLFSCHTLRRMVLVLHPWHAPTILTRTSSLFEIFMCAEHVRELCVCMTASETESFVKAYNKCGLEAIRAAAYLLHKNAHFGNSLPEVVDFVNNSLRNDSLQSSVQAIVLNALCCWVQCNNNEYVFDDYRDDPYFGLPLPLCVPTPVHVYDGPISLGQRYSAAAHERLEQCLSASIQPLAHVIDAIEYTTQFAFSNCTNSRLTVARALERAIEVSNGPYNLGLVDAFVLMVFCDKDSNFLRYIEDRLLVDDVDSLRAHQLEILRYFLEAVDRCPSCGNSRVSYSLQGDYSACYTINSKVTWNTIRTCTYSSTDNPGSFVTEFHFNLTTNRARRLSGLFSSEVSGSEDLEFLLPLFSHYVVVNVDRSVINKTIILFQELEPGSNPRFACLEPARPPNVGIDGPADHHRPQRFSRLRNVKFGSNPNGADPESRRAKHQWNCSVVNVVGAPQSGKTTIVRMLCRPYPRDNVAPQDAYLTHGASVVECDSSSFPDESPIRLNSLVKSTSAGLAEYFLTANEFAYDNVLNVMSPLFVRRNVLTLLVFDMSKLDGGNATVELDALDCWLQHLLLRSANGDGSVAPVILIGTRADLVESYRYPLIGERLKERFGGYNAWTHGSVITCRTENGHLPFFPVDGIQDDSCEWGNLYKSMALALDRSEYVHEEVPLNWRSFLESIAQSGHMSKTMEEITAAARACDVPVDTIPQMLRFLHDCGELTWFPQETLENTVILDPVALLYFPITRLLCTKYCTGATMDCHNDCQGQYPSEYLLYRSGFLSSSLVSDALLGDFGHRGSLVVEVLCAVKAMVKWNRISNSGNECVYLIPSLLPHGQHASNELDIRPEAENSLILLFVDHPYHSSAASASDFCSRGLLPKGLFESIVVKLASRATVDALRSCLTRRSFRSTQGQLFRLTVCPGHRCIQVDISHAAPWKVYRRLQRVLKNVTESSFPTVQFLPYLPIVPASRPRATSSSSDSFAAEAVFIRLESIPTVTADNLINDHFGDQIDLLEDNIRQQYAAWTALETCLDKYDAFISYRHGDPVDATAIDGLLDALAVHRFENREVDVFYDAHCIGIGVDFQSVYFRSLMATTVIAPIVSPHALNRMRTADHEVTVDNLLVEWIAAVVAVTGHFDPAVLRVRRIVPVFVGSVQKGIMHDDIDEYIRQLPVVRPAASIRKFTELLENAALPTSASLQNQLGTMTVRGIVESIKVHTGIFLCHLYGKEHAYRDCSDTIIRALGVADQTRGPAVHADRPPRSWCTVDPARPPRSWCWLCFAHYLRAQSERFSLFCINSGKISS